MKKLTRTIAAVSALAMSVGALSACGGSNVNADKGHVYFLSMKVEFFQAEEGIRDDRV